MFQTLKLFFKQKPYQSNNLRVPKLWSKIQNQPPIYKDLTALLQIILKTYQPVKLKLTKLLP